MSRTVCQDLASVGWVKNLAKCKWNVFLAQYTRGLVQFTAIHSRGNLILGY